MLEALISAADNSFRFVVAALIVFLVSAAIYAIFITIRYIKNPDKMLLNNMPGGVFICLKDDGLTIKYFNANFLNMLGYSKKELCNFLGSKLINIIAKEDLGSAFKNLHEQLSLKEDFEIKVRLIKKDGSPCWMLWKGKKTIYRNKEYLNSEIFNVNEYIYSQNRTKIDEERYRIVAESSDSVIFEYNIKDKTIFYTHKYKTKFGEEPICENFPDSFIDSGKLHKEDVKKFLIEFNKILYGKPSGKTEIRIKKADGEFIWCEMRYTSIFDDNGVPIRVIGKYVDVDKVKKETENLKKVSETDSFTGLYNKTSVLSYIDKYISENTEKKHALFFIDIDNFKSVNDTFGHLYGDKMLIKITQTIKSQFRYSDLIGRVGGDEFVVFVKDYIDEGFIQEKAAALCRSISQIKTEKGEMAMAASIGITLYPKNGDTLALLYDKADIALYAAKSQGGNKFRIFSQDLMAGRYKYHDKDKTANLDSNSENMEFLVELVDILYTAKNTAESVNGVLGKLGEKFSADRVYIAEIDEGGKPVIKFEWHNGNTQGITAAQDYEKYEDGLCRLQKINGIINTSLSDNGKFLLQCKLAPNGKFKGFLNVCRGNQEITFEEEQTLIYLAKALEKRMEKTEAEKIS
jgi:diguanylate cyclase (GGDEF)-like protein/PAS domain S-box-containing protein